MSVLSTLADHNAWANKLVFEACAAVSHERLSETAGGYDSVLGILNHLVQVENAFYELAHGRSPTWTPLTGLDALRDRCDRVDRAFMEHAAALDPSDPDGFVVPWFGFEITRAEGVLQPLTHSHKHRADVSMLLPGLGGAGVEMDLIQWLAEQRGPRA